MNPAQPADAVISRIRKLMALTAERGATEAEAQLAAEHVQRLLAEHNLSMSAIEASGGSTGEGGKRAREGVGHRQVYKWQRTLMASIAKLNYCKSIERFQSRGFGKPDVFDGYDLIGRVDNVATTRVMFEYLLQTIERLARGEVKDPTQYFTRYAHSFKEGCADRVVERMQERRDQMIKEQEAKARADAVRSKHPGAASSNLPAVILSDVVQTEADLNTDFNLGRAPGTTARLRREAEEQQQRAADERARRAAKALVEGFSEMEAYYTSYGYTPESARQLATPEPVKPARPETERQREKRQEREERDNERYWQRQHRENQRLDRGAYRKGAEAGDGVSLDRQVDRQQRRGLK